MRFQPAILLSSLSLLVVTVSACTGGDCAECRDEKCPDLVTICRQDQDCACLSDCLGEKGIPGMEGCLDSCGLGERPAVFLPLEECVASGCPDGDECSVPAGYEVPDITTCDRPDTGIGSGSLADCGFDTDLEFDPRGAVLQLQSADGNVCVRVERRNDGSGGLANTKWTLLEIRLGPLGEVALIDDPATLCWFSSHHNLIDWAHAWTGSRHYDLKVEGPAAGGRYRLHTFEQGPVDPDSCAPTTDGVDCVGDPVDLFPVNP